MTKKRKTVLLVLAACVLFGLLYATTYIPRKLITIDPASISKIEIFDGTRGESRTITAAEDLDHIIANLNRITFQKGKCSFGYTGYRFRLTIYNQKGKEHQSLIINSSDLIRYRGFFYTDKENSIDIDYITNMFGQ
jgi:hypothetical protein